jgi:YaiO family outer membrane protein
MTLPNIFRILSACTVLLAANVAPGRADNDAPVPAPSSPPASSAPSLSAQPNGFGDGILTFEDQISSLSSPGDLYGPWNVAKLQYQWQQGNDIPSMTYVNRVDSDKAGPSHSNGLYADDYHTWTDTFYTYAQANVASGNSLPGNSIYLEGDFKFLPDRSLVGGIGGGVLTNPGGATTRWLSVGPTLYTNGPMVYTVRYLPANTDGIGTSATELVAEYNRVGHDQVTVSYIFGSQPSILAGAPASLALIQNLNETDILWNHWLTKRFGFVLGGTFGNHYDRATGVNLYNQSALWLGLFVGRAVGLPQ